MLVDYTMMVVSLLSLVSKYAVLYANECCF